MCKQALVALVLIGMHEFVQACSILQGPGSGNETSAAQRYVQRATNTSMSVFVGVPEHIAALYLDKTGRPIGNAKIVVFKVLRGWGKSLDPQVRLEYSSLCPPRSEPLVEGTSYLIFAGRFGVRHVVDMDRIAPYQQFLGEHRYEYVRGRLRITHNNSLNTDARDAGAG